MRHLCLFPLRLIAAGLCFACLASLGFFAQAQVAPKVNTGPGGRNPLADPFAAAARTDLAARAAPAKAVAPAAAPVAAAPATARSLPAGLRVILIRDNGQALLATAEAGAPSIAVSHGHVLRLQDQDFRAEVSAGAVQLWSVAGGRLVWEGTLAGNTQLVLAPDLSQFKYVPPLSAGVDPGLGANGSAARAQPAPAAKLQDGGR